MNKSRITNLVTLVIIGASFLLPAPYREIVLSTGLFALSGAVTNWLAIHMLFERVPGLYGSGVIPAHFEDFKLGIHELIMHEFFTRENIEKFFSAKEDGIDHFDLSPLIRETSFGPAFDGLVDVIMASSFGGMLGMLGGKSALDSLREPFESSLRSSLIAISETESFQQTLKANLAAAPGKHDLHEKVSAIVRHRLDELTPQLVKEIVQRMIQQHLGWLVVWGGVFGGAIGFLVAIVR